jgi:hypothetical protein
MELDKRYTSERGWREAMPHEGHLISRFTRVLADGGITRTEYAALPNGECGTDLYIPHPFSIEASELFMQDRKPRTVVNEEEWMREWHEEHGD